MAKTRYQFTAAEAQRFMELRARQESERIARAVLYQQTKVFAKMAAQESLDATTEASYQKMEQVGMWNRIGIDMADPHSIRINKTVGREKMKEVTRAITMYGKTKTLYQRFLNRCLVLSYRSMYHANDSTNIGYLKNTPLMYKGYAEIGYASGSLYDSIKIQSSQVNAGGVSQYGETSQEFRFAGPSFNKYGKILATGNRKIAAIKIAPLMAWVQVKIARGVWRGKDKPRSQKGLLRLAIAISQSFDTHTKFGDIAGGDVKGREPSIPDWYKWNGNPKVQRMFKKFHDRGVTKYYQMLLNDIKKKLN